MKKYPIIIILLFFSVGKTYCQEEDSAVLHGRVLSEYESPIKFAHISIENSVKGTISDMQGLFNLEIKQSNKLLISCLGYKTKRISFPQKIDGEVFKTIYLSKDTIDLAETTIRPWPATYRKLKEGIENMDFEDKYSFQTQDKFLNEEMQTAKKLSLRNIGEQPLAITGPFSLIYNAFGNKPRQLRQLPVQMAQANREQIIKSKFNIDIIKKVTKMNDEDSIHQFIEYCNYSEDYLVYVDEYDLIIDLTEKFKAFGFK